MRIANYLRPECVALHQRADSLEGAVQQLVALLDGTEDLTDTAAFAADVRARLALGGVCVGNGLAIPHAKSASVKRLQLAALTLDPPLACDTPDGKPLQMLVMIAAPAEANDLHVQVLAELATLFLDTDFCTHLRESTTPDAFCRAVAEREAQDDPAAPPPQTTDEPGYRLLGVTACPTGIAHTYLAAEALQRAAQTRGFSIKVETNGADGVEDALTEEDIRAADCIIVAADRAVSMARFVGKRLVYASAGDAVRDADALLEKAVSGKAPIYHGGHAFRTSDLRELGREGYGHLMNGVSHMIPVVVAGGVITALSLLSQQLGLPASWTMMMKNVGAAAFVMMYPVLAAFIASSIGDRPAFMPGLLGGYLAQMGTTTLTNLSWISSGFWGALIGGFAAGLIVLLLNRLLDRIPQELSHIRTGLLVPACSLLFIGWLMLMVVNPPLGRFNRWMSLCLSEMQGGSRLLLGAAALAGREEVAGEEGEDETATELGVTLTVGSRVSEIPTWRVEKVDVEKYRITSKEGDMVYLGGMKNDQLEGEGVLYYKNGGKLFEGSFCRNRWNGMGMWFFPNGTLHYKGMWKDGEMDGEGMLYRPVNIEYSNSDFRRYVRQTGEKNPHLSFARGFNPFTIGEPPKS